MYHNHKILFLSVCLFTSKEFEIHAVSNSIESGYLFGYRPVGIYGRYQRYFSKGDSSLSIIFPSSYRYMTSTISH